VQEKQSKKVLKSPHLGMKQRTTMKTAKKTRSFQGAIETVEALSLEDQAMILEIIRHRLIQQQRADLIQQVAEARQDYRDGRVRRGTVDDILAELDS
jgi:hypothetical protein